MMRNGLRMTAREVPRVLGHGLRAEHEPGTITRSCSAAGMARSERGSLSSRDPLLERLMTYAARIEHFRKEVSDRHRGLGRSRFDVVEQTNAPDAYPVASAAHKM
jgi:hypothetical protein